MAERDFGEFYAGNYGRLVIQVYAVTGNLADAEDAVQEAFARASVRWGRVGGYNSPEGWVRRVALNLAFTGCGGRGGCWRSCAGRRHRRYHRCRPTAWPWSRRSRPCRWGSARCWCCTT